jgi:carboxymethylenebutenolidase
MHQHVTLSVADGTSMQCYVSAPEGKGPFPAIIVLQEAFGVNGHMRKVTDQWAAKGYLAISPELFHRTAPAGFEASYSDFSQVMPHYQAISNEGLEADLKACFQYFESVGTVDLKKVASVGYCLGGRVSFVANAVLPLAAGISYYGGGIDQVAFMAPNISGPHLFLWGGLDTHIPAPVRERVLEAMDGAGKSYANVVFSYANHAFSCDERPAYNADASAEAWAISLAFLKNKLAL